MVVQRITTPIVLNILCRFDMSLELARCIHRERCIRCQCSSAPRMRRHFRRPQTWGALLHIQSIKLYHIFRRASKPPCIGCQQEVDEADRVDLRELTTSAATVGISDRAAGLVMMRPRFRNLP